MSSEMFDEDEVKCSKKAEAEFNHWLGTRVITAIIIIVTAVVFCTSQRLRSGNPEDYIVTVVDKVQKGDNSSSKGLAYCETSDGETIVFEDTRMPLQGKSTEQKFFDSLQVGGRYTVRAVGVELPMFSNFRNIVDVKEYN